MLFRGDEEGVNPAGLQVFAKLLPSHRVFVISDGIDPHGHIKALAHFVDCRLDRLVIDLARCADAEPLDSYRDDITIEVQPVDELVTWAKGVQPLFAVLAALAGVGSATFAFLRFREEKKQTKVMSSKPE